MFHSTGCSVTTCKAELLRLAVRQLQPQVYYRELVSQSVSMGSLKMTDMKMTDQIAGHENAGHEIAGHENARHEIARHDKYLFIVLSTNSSSFSSIVENWI